MPKVGVPKPPKVKVPSTKPPMNGRIVKEIKERYTPPKDTRLGHYHGLDIMKHFNF